MNNSIRKLDNLTDKEKMAVDDLIRGLEKLYGDNLSRVILYGSKARGDSDNGSDIDIMIVVKDYKNREKEFNKISDLSYGIIVKYNYDLLLSFTLKKETEYLTRESPLMLNVRKEGIEI
ncbi:MAG: nucleotidyltransferase domain-containing protein [Elusimicrobiota bacterium]|nr:nucleotidyltransferase domain-containing protein [Elusimicrobiota bacterium]